MFGMILRESKYQADASYDLVLKYGKESRGTDADGYKAEFVKLVESCQLLGGRKGR
jgi:Ca-activated chloride channel family protein